MKKITFTVYDRWGIKICQSENVLPRWDGKFNGADSAAGTFFWIVTYENMADRQHQESGFITLMR